jgi:hypothetical protein
LDCFVKSFPNVAHSATNERERMHKKDSTAQPTANLTPHRHVFGN